MGWYHRRVHGDSLSLSSSGNIKMKLALLSLFVAGISSAYGVRCPVTGGTCVKFYSADGSIGQAAGPTVPPRKAPECTVCRAKSVAAAVTDATVIIPTCNADDTFTARQYDSVKDESWCVDAWGKEHPGSRQKGPDSDCSGFTPAPATTKAPTLGPCAAKQKSLATNNPNQLSLECTEDGFYSASQCWQGFCWCTLRHGAMVPDTMHQMQAGRVDCAVHYDMKPSMCSGAGVTLVDYPGLAGTNCNRYVSCGDHVAFSCVCPTGLLFNAKEGACTYPGDAECN